MHNTVFSILVNYPVTLVTVNVKAVVDVMFIIIVRLMLLMHTVIRYAL